MSSPKHFARRAAQKGALSLFRIWEAMGLHVVPDHFYYPVPSTSDLTEAAFARRYSCVGVDWNEHGQLAHIPLVAKYASEAPFEKNEGLSLLDAAVLHGMVRHYRPRKMVEVGSGDSTAIAARACRTNAAEGDPVDFTAIEPYPNPRLRAGIQGLTRLLPERVQEVEIGLFRDCDLLFIDSSHVVKLGSDVNHLVLEVLPRLPPGALVHFHDILLPGEYWREWVRDRHLFWTEQYLVHAFLLFNREFEVLWASRFLDLSHRDALTRAFPFFEPDRHRITSLWLRRRSDGGPP